jgi:hypothetical protein
LTLASDNHVEHLRHVAITDSHPDCRKLSPRLSRNSGQRAAAMYTLIQTCRLNNVDPHAWLADVIARMPDHPQTRIEELLPWNWIPTGQTIKIKQAA